MSQQSASAHEVAGHFFRHEGAKVVAALTAHLGAHRLQLAEDVVQEALLRALQTWSYHGVPDNPAAWLTQVAKNLAINALQREQRWNEKQDGIATERERWLSAPADDVTHETFADDTLRMMFVCFHPALAAEAQTALALRPLCGFSPAEIATAFLASEAAIAKRLVRARSASVSWRCPLPCLNRLSCRRGSAESCTRFICSSTKATKPLAVIALCARISVTKPSDSSPCSQSIPPRESRAPWRCSP